jgi:hypothetical protein
MKSKLIIVCLLIMSQLSAQILSPNVRASAGQYKEASGVSISYTVGEPLIQTAISGSTIVTLGFNQPESILNAVVDVDGQSIIIKAFPNPVIDNLTIDLSKALTQSLDLTLLDIHGQKAYRQKADIGTTQLQIPTKDMPVGVYFVEMRQTNGVLLHTFKIFKSL